MFESSIEIITSALTKNNLVKKVWFKTNTNQSIGFEVERSSKISKDEIKRMIGKPVEVMFTSFGKVENIYLA